jgi:hypothetical protein
VIEDGGTTIEVEGCFILYFHFFGTYEPSSVSLLLIRSLFRFVASFLGTEGTTSVEVEDVDDEGAVATSVEEVSCCKGSRCVYLRQVYTP